MTHSTLRRTNHAARSRKQMNTTLGPGPRAATIQAILGYSKALKVVEAPPIGTIALVLN